MRLGKFYLYFSISNTFSNRCFDKFPDCCPGWSDRGSICVYKQGSWLVNICIFEFEDSDARRLSIYIYIYTHFESFVRWDLIAFLFLNVLFCSPVLWASLYVHTWVCTVLKQILADNSPNILHRTTCDMSCIYRLFTNMPVVKDASLNVVYTGDPIVFLSRHWKESEQTACMEESINKQTYSVLVLLQ